MVGKVPGTVIQLLTVIFNLLKKADVSFGLYCDKAVIIKHPTLLQVNST